MQKWPGMQLTRGYTAVKFDIDEANDPNKYDRWNWTASLAEIERMYNSMAAVRKEIGPHIDICVTCTDGMMHQPEERWQK